MKNLKHLIVFFFLVSLCAALPAQKTAGNSSKIQKRRAVAAKLLVELDKIPQTNNHNNGKSNKSGCCNDEIMAPSDYDVLTFGLNSSWYLSQEGTGYVGIPNPIPYFQSITPTWDVFLYKGDGTFLEAKAGHIQDNELLISIQDMQDGRYFIELEYDGDSYFTGFRIGEGGTVPTSDSANKKN